MPEWNVGYGGFHRTSATVNLSGSSTPHAVGSWVEVIPETQDSISGFILGAYHVSGGAPDGLLTLSYGTAGNEVPFAENLVVTGGRAYSVFQYVLQLPIPRASRISARLQNSTANGGVYIQLIQNASGFLATPRMGRLITMGANTADSGGVQVDPGATPNTKGLYSQVTASCPGDIQQLLVGIGQQANTTRTDAIWNVDIAVGADGSEVPILSNLIMACSAQADTITPFVFGPFTVSIPAGSRLSARASCSMNDASDRLFDVILYGIEG